jgi:signal transduction histidine kinase
MLGYSKEALLKIPILNLHPAEELSLSAEALHSIVKKGAYRLQSKFVRADGTIINADISSKIVDREKKIVQSIARDITELKKTQEQLKHSQVLASLGEMTAGIAHEVNNPLGVVLLYSELLLRDDMPRQAKKDLKVIHDEAARAAKIMTDLLTYGNAVKFQVRRLNLHKILQKVLDMRRYQERVQNIITSSNLRDDPLYVNGDSSQFTQVFMNLILNAEEALRERNGGNILITTQIDREWAKVSIADNGAGIPEENLNQVFHPFFTTKKIGEGTGLGLSTCYGIITAHGGLIRAENNEMGGATFTVELPLAKAEREGSLRRETEKANSITT